MADDQVFTSEHFTYPSRWGKIKEHALTHPRSLPVSRAGEMVTEQSLIKSREACRLHVYKNKGTKEVPQLECWIDHLHICTYWDKLVAESVIPADLIAITTENPPIVQATTYAHSVIQGDQAASVPVEQIGGLELGQEQIPQPSEDTVSAPKPMNHLFSPDQYHPVRVGWDEATGLPIGAMDFFHPEIFRNFVGPKYAYLNAFVADWRATLDIRYQRLFWNAPKSGRFIIWVEPKNLGREQGLAEAKLNVEKGITKWAEGGVASGTIDSFYKANRSLFHPPISSGSGTRGNHSSIRGGTNQGSSRGAGAASRGGQTFRGSSNARGSNSRGRGTRESLVVSKEKAREWTAGWETTKAEEEKSNQEAMVEHNRRREAGELPVEGAICPETFKYKEPGDTSGWGGGWSLVP